MCMFSSIWFYHISPTTGKPQVVPSSTWSLILLFYKHTHQPLVDIPPCHLPSPTLSLAAGNNKSVSQIYNFSLCYINGILGCLRLASFPQYKSLETNSHPCVYHLFLLFYCWIVFHGMDFPWYIYLCAFPKLLGFLFWAVSVKPANNTCSYF